jgi:hypothetical protein
LLDIIYNLVFQDGHVYMHSKAMDGSGGLGARKTDILKRIDLQDTTDSESQMMTGQLSREIRIRAGWHSPN